MRNSENRVGIGGKLIVTGRLLFGGAAIAAPGILIACGGSGEADPSSTIHQTISPSKTADILTPAPSVTDVITASPTASPTPQPETPVQTPEPTASEYGVAPTKDVLMDSINSALAIYGSTPNLFDQSLANCFGEGVDPNSPTYAFDIVGGCTTLAQILVEMYQNNPTPEIATAVDTLKGFTVGDEGVIDEQAGHIKNPEGLKAYIIEQNYFSLNPQQ